MKGIFDFSITALRGVLPFVIGGTVTATVLFAFFALGSDFNEIAKALAFISIAILILVIVFWVMYKFFIVELKKRSSHNFINLIKDLSNNPDNISDKCFQKERILPIIPAGIKACAAWFSATTSITIAVTIVANVTLLATLAVQFLQVERIEAQNKLLKTQNQLTDGQRTSLLLQELSQVLNLIHEENKNIKDDKKVQISEGLQGRIIALTHSFRPYNFLNDDGQLYEQRYSPEKAYLLTSIVHSGIDLTKILAFGDFSKMYTEFMNLKDVKIKSGRFNSSLFNKSKFELTEFDESIFVQSTFYEAEFISSMFSMANFTSAIFEKSDFEDVIFSQSTMLDTTFMGGYFNSAQFEFTNLNLCNFINLKISNTKFIASDLRTCRFRNTEFSNVDFKFSVLPNDFIKNNSLFELKGVDLRGALVLDVNWLDQVEETNNSDFKTLSLVRVKKDELLEAAEQYFIDNKIFSDYCSNIFICRSYFEHNQEVYLIK